MTKPFIFQSYIMAIVLKTSSSLFRVKTKNILKIVFIVVLAHLYMSCAMLSRMNFFLSRVNGKKLLLLAMELIKFRAFEWLQTQICTH